MVMDLYRIGAVALLWAEWAGPWRAPHHLDDPVSLVVAIVLGFASFASLFPIRYAPLVTAAIGLVFLAWAPDANTIEAWLILSLLACTGTTNGVANARWVMTGFFAASALHHLQLPWLTGVRLEQLFVARFGLVVGPRWGLAIAAVAWLLLEVVLGAGLWVERARRAVPIVGVVVFGAVYVGLFTGTLSAAVIFGLALASGWSLQGVNKGKGTEITQE